MLFWPEPENLPSQHIYAEVVFCPIHIRICKQKTKKSFHQSIGPICRRGPPFLFPVIVHAHSIVTYSIYSILPDFNIIHSIVGVTYVSLPLPADLHFWTNSTISTSKNRLIAQNMYARGIIIHSVFKIIRSVHVCFVSVFLLFDSSAIATTPQSIPLFWNLNIYSFNICRFMSYVIACISFQVLSNPDENHCNITSDVIRQCRHTLKKKKLYRSSELSARVLIKIALAVWEALVGGCRRAVVEYGGDYKICLQLNESIQRSRQ